MVSGRSRRGGVFEFFSFVFGARRAPPRCLFEAGCSTKTRCERAAQGRRRCSEGNGDLWSCPDNGRAEETRARRRPYLGKYPVAAPHTSYWKHECSQQYCTGSAWCPPHFGLEAEVPMPEESTARMFLCARCSTQTIVCRRCDRGQIYCGRECSRQARRTSMRAAGRRYQQSLAGRFRHAARAHRYRQRQQKVTHQGSAAAVSDDLLPAVAPEVTANEVRCRFCGARCAPWVRQNFVARGRPAGFWIPGGLHGHRSRN